MKKYYVYAHSAPSYGVFYIGKGSGERLFKTGNRSAFWKSIVKKYGFTASILQAFDLEEDAYSAEMEWISYFKGLGQCAANFTIGGDGVRVKKRWWYDKVSASLTGIKRPRGQDSKSYKPLISKDDLTRMYVFEKMPSWKIAEISGLSITTIYDRLKEYGIELHPGKNKSVVCVNDGRVFSSIQEAARETGLYRENIRKVLSGKYKTTGGLTFKYGEQS